MKPASEIWHDDPDLALDLLQERAALIEEGEGCTRNVAENYAAELAGFRNWIEANMKIKRRRKELEV